jgi:hypothetical protein
VFKGVSEYLEDLVAWIDAAPLLDYLEIYFFGQPTFHTPHLSRFISHVPKFQALNDARVVISTPTVGDISVTVPSPSKPLGHRVITIKISYRDRGLRPSYLTQLCTSSLPLFLTVEHLYLTYPHPGWISCGSTLWLEFLHPFTAVKNLYLSNGFAQCIAPALGELVGERVTEVLPALQNLLLAETQPSKHVQQAIEQFVCARQLSSRPIVVSKCDILGFKGRKW